MMGLKSMLKGVGDSVVESFRPAIQRTATEKLEEFKRDGLDELSSDIKQILQTTYDGLSKAGFSNDADEKVASINGNKSSTVTSLAKFILKMILSDKNQPKLDKFLAEFVEDLKPVLFEVLEGTDTELTDYAVKEIKIACHILPEEKEEPIQTDIGHWPLLVKPGDDAELIDKLGFKVRAKVRKFLERLLPSVLRVMPDVLLKATVAFVTAETREDFANNETGIGFWDKFMDKVEDKVLALKQRGTKEFVEFVWDAIDETIAEQLKGNLLDMENSIVDQVKETVSVLPGI
jgi:hypothetical protein